MNLFSNFKTDKTADYQNISAEQLENVIAEKGISSINLLDVRTPDEFHGGHIPGAKNVNIMGPTFSNYIENLDKDATYYVYCASGNRSKTACSTMASRGFKNVFNVRFGIMAWNGDIA